LVRPCLRNSGGGGTGVNQRALNSAGVRISVSGLYRNWNLWNRSSQEERTICRGRSSPQASVHLTRPQKRGSPHKPCRSWGSVQPHGVAPRFVTDNNFSKSLSANSADSPVYKGTSNSELKSTPSVGPQSPCRLRRGESPATGPSGPGGSGSSLHLLEPQPPVLRRPHRRPR